MKKYLYDIVSRLISLVPTKKQICLSSYPDLDDNSYALFKSMLSLNVNKHYKIVWIVFDKNRLSLIRDSVKDLANVRVAYKYSFDGVWTYVRSRFAFDTHGLFPNLKLQQHDNKHICLWHGMPLKKIGASIGEPCSKNCDYTIASGELFRPFMAEAFGLPLEKVIVSGQPRCDMLFEGYDSWSTIGIERTHYERVGVWMPTYRKSIVGEIREDGTYADNRITFLSFEDLSRLDDALVQIKTLLIIKIHPMDVLQKAIFPEYKNIKIILPNQHELKLYPFIGACDFLLTDYSSVFIDYEITNKPMAFVMDDIEAYRSTRGLYFNDLKSMLPGPILSNFNSLLDFIKQPFYSESQYILNQFKDKNAGERLMKELNII